MCSWKKKMGKINIQRNVQSNTSLMMISTVFHTGFTAISILYSHITEHKFIFQFLLCFFCTCVTLTGSTEALYHRNQRWRGRHQCTAFLKGQNWREKKRKKKKDTESSDPTPTQHNPHPCVISEV